MTRQERAKLASAMNEVIAFHLNRGDRITTSQICEQMREERPDLVVEAADRLIGAAMASMANTLLKRASKQEREEMRINLFGNREAGLTIPKSIALPSPDNKREMVWVSTTAATLAELDSYLLFLESGIKADQRKYTQIQTFRDRVLELADSDDLDRPINEMLRGLRRGKAA